MGKAKTTPHRAFVAAVALYESQAACAAAIGKTPARISQIINDREGICPVESVLTVERDTGVSRHLLRPDIYPPGEQQETFNGRPV